ncbi:MAG TPA: hypothetical protein VLK29_03350 [Luteimonas sp.]|nr:hypothetical protein [Luteimonas sp.]
MSTPAPPPARGNPPKRGPSAASRYLFVFLLGLAIGIVLLVMALRAWDARKTWQDRYPTAVMQVMQAHVEQLRATTLANRCAATDTLPQFKALRELANDLEPAFPDLSREQDFATSARGLRGSLDQALASPPLNCAGVTAALESVGENCSACHQAYRN